MRHVTASAICPLLAMLCGCGGAEDTKDANSANNYGYGYAYDFISSEGTRLRNLPGILEITQEEFDIRVAQSYRETEKCAEIVTGGPLVVIVKMDQEEKDRGLQAVGVGRTFLNTGLIIVSPTAITDPYFYTGNPETGRRPGTSTLRHEYIHYLLGASGFPQDLNFSHQSPLFVQCSDDSVQSSAIFHEVAQQ